MPSAQFAARVINDYFPRAKVELERGALHGKQLGSYNNDPGGKLTVTCIEGKMKGTEVASVVQAHVTQEIAPGPGLNELKQRLELFKSMEEED